MAVHEGRPHDFPTGEYIDSPDQVLRFRLPPFVHSERETFIELHSRDLRAEGVAPHFNVYPFGYFSGVQPKPI